MIFYVMKKENLDCNIEKYKIFNEQGLKKIHYENFITRLFAIQNSKNPVRDVDPYL